MEVVLSILIRKHKNFKHLDLYVRDCKKADRSIFSESSHQINCVNWFRNKYPNAKLVATVNERNSSGRDMAKLKRQGLVTGFPDLTIIYKKKTAYPEMKRENVTDSAIDADQLIQLDELQRQGFFVAVCFGFEAFKVFADRVMVKFKYK